MPARTLTPDFNEEVVKIRNVDFRLRELSIGEYDNLVKKATVTKPNPLTGEDEEVTDNQLLLRFMVLSCVIEPKLDAQKLDSMPTRAVLKLNQTVNRMHFGDEPAEEVEESVTDDEEEEKGNA